MAMNIQCSDKGSYNDAYTVLLKEFVKHLRVDTIILISFSAHPQVLCKDINQDEAVAYGATVQVRRKDEETRGRPSCLLCRWFVSGML